jgi:hypothetical protein
VAEQVFAGADIAFQRRVQRWIAHGDIRSVCIWVSQLEGRTQGSPPAHIAALLAPAGSTPAFDADATLIAYGFLELNEKREEADYDHDAVFTRPDTRELIALADEALAAVKRAQSTQSQRFFGLIAMKANVRQRQ